MTHSAPFARINATYALLRIASVDPLASVDPRDEWPKRRSNPSIAARKMGGHRQRVVELTAGS